MKVEVERSYFKKGSNEQLKGLLGGVSWACRSNIHISFKRLVTLFLLPFEDRTFILVVDDVTTR